MENINIIWKKHIRNSEYCGRFNIRGPSVLPRFMRNKNKFCVILDSKTLSLKCYVYSDDNPLVIEPRLLHSVNIRPLNIIRIRLKKKDCAFKIINRQGEWKFFASNAQQLNFWWEKLLQVTQK